MNRTAVGWQCMLPGAVAALLALVAGSTAAEPAAPPHIDLIIQHARVFDGHAPQLLEDREIRIGGNKILAVNAPGTPDASDTAGARVIDAGGRVVTPGLIDAHTHPMINLAIPALKDADPNYVTARATVELHKMLMRGFTTIRDTGGPVFGVKQAIDEGLIDGPRIFPSGAIISQTSGHADYRGRNTAPRRWGGEIEPTEKFGYGLIADGPDEVLTAVREQLRLGATQIKLAAGGGISSNYDPIDSVQFLDAELRAAVAAAADWGTYVTVHAYTATAIRRSIEAGVRCIEHGHLIDEPTMQLIAARGVWLSPQAFVFGAGGASLFSTRATSAASLTAAQLAQRQKSQLVSAGLDQMMRLAKKYRVKIAFGTDMFGSPLVFDAQLREFGARLQWFSSAEVLRQATGNNGDLLGMSGPRNTYGKLGVIEPGALADLLIVDGNPLEDVRVLENSEKNLRAIIKDGKVYKLTL